DIYIINVRFAGDIIYEKHFPETLSEIEDTAMPGMILQPIVENAVQHGIREMLGEGMISFTIEVEEKYIRLIISDNGIGMTEEEINAVMQGKRRTESGSGGSGAPGNSNGIALDNVLKRLSLYYNREDLLRISSEGKDMGTEVEILLPLKRGDLTDVSNIDS
ncbi:MAG: histidine kinase, partial [Blautia sp.]|nr:histidine kinase [Blautia sp.]